MPLYQCILTNNPCYKTKRSITPLGVMVHSTGANNPALKRYVQPLDKDDADAYNPNRSKLLELLGVNKNKNDWNHTTREVGVHAFIGKLADGSVAAVQTLPWTHRAWHAGKGTSGKSANDTHIAFEICEDDLTDKLYFEETKDQAVCLTATLCLLHNLDPMADGVIICHQDGYKLGIASNHGDIYNWWNKHNYTMDDFRREVNNLLVGEVKEDMGYYAYLKDVPEYYRPTIDKIIDKGGLIGTGDGRLDLSEDFCRVMTVLDRMGKL